MSPDKGGETFDSQFMASGDSFEFIFDKAGTYEYYCTLHPFMNGKIVVSRGKQVDLDYYQ